MRTRRSENYGTPQESVRWAKKQRLRRLAAQFLASGEGFPGIKEFRFDVVALRLDGEGKLKEITLLKNAF